jgi:chitin deacetylase
MIGGNIILNPDPFLSAFNAGHDIGCHTWSHPYMTQKTNDQVLAELGWTMQLIHNSTGGRVPRYWRPPYGDNDQRTRAIAIEVFGLQAVYWNHDSLDYTFGTSDEVVASVSNIITTSAKSPGAITLEHEITDPDVDGFIAAFPGIAASGWQFKSLARVLNDGTTYLNANSSTSDVSLKGILISDPTTTSSTPTATASAANSSVTGATQLTSSGSSLLLTHETPASKLFFSFIIFSTVVFLTLK